MSWLSYDCHMLSCFFFSRRFSICFHGWRMLTVCDALVSCAAPRPTCGDDRSPRGRIPSCLARCRFHTEKFTNFTGRARDFSRLGATGLLFQLDLPPSPLIPVDPRWSPLIPLHVLTCQEHGMELVAPRSSSEVPGKVPSVTWNLWLFGLFYLLFG